MHPDIYQQFRRASVRPATFTVAGACAYGGFSRSAAYRLLGAGKLKAVKQGSTTLILGNSIDDYLASLPAATFRPARAA